MTSFADVSDLADTVAEDRRVWRNFSTAIGEALTVAAESFDAVSMCQRKVIDMSGDGISNEGLAPEMVKPLLRQRNITVNGLVIEGTENDVTGHYFENVITGPGAFVVTANGHLEYPERIREKLRREVVEQVSSVRSAGN